MATQVQSLPQTATRTSAGRRRAYASGWGWLFSAPFFVLYILFLLWPVLSAARTSLFDESLVGHSAWRGLKNYSALLSGSQWGAAMWHTPLFTLLSTPPLVLVAPGPALPVRPLPPLPWLVRPS